MYIDNTRMLSFFSANLLHKHCLFTGLRVKALPLVDCMESLLSRLGGGCSAYNNIILVVLIIVYICTVSAFTLTGGPYHS